MERSTENSTDTVTIILREVIWAIVYLTALQEGSYMKEDRPLIPVIKTLWQWKRTLLITAVITAILSSAIMLLKPNYYASSTLFYPVNSALLEPINPRNQVSQGYFGDDHDVDRILSIGNSNELVMKIISDYNLAEHYKINASTPKGQSKVRKRFRKLYDIRKTSYDAIEVNIEDTDRELAAKVALSISTYINEKVLELTKTSQSSMISSLRSSIAAKSSELAEVTDTIRTYRERYNIYDTKSQGEALANLEIKSPGSLAVKKRINDYNSGISDIIKLEVRQEALSKSLAANQDELNNVLAAYKERPSALHIIEEATVPIEKSRPRRSLYVIGAVILVTGLAKLAILLLTFSDKFIREAE